MSGRPGFYHIQRCQYAEELVVSGAVVTYVYDLVESFSDGVPFGVATYGGDQLEDALNMKAALHHSQRIGKTPPIIRGLGARSMTDSVNGQCVIPFGVGGSMPIILLSYAKTCPRVFVVGYPVDQDLERVAITMEAMRRWMRSAVNGVDDKCSSYCLSAVNRRRRTTEGGLDKVAVCGFVLGIGWEGEYERVVSDGEVEGQIGALTFWRAFGTEDCCRCY